jgi:hypothetical protein
MPAVPRRGSFTPAPDRVLFKREASRPWNRSATARSASPADAKLLVDVVPRFRRPAGVARRRRGDVGGPGLAMADRGRQRARAHRTWDQRRRLVRRVLCPGSPGQSCGQGRRCHRPRPTAWLFKGTRQGHAPPFKTRERRTIIAPPWRRRQLFTAMSPRDSPKGTRQQHSRVAAEPSPRRLHRRLRPELATISKTYN